MDWVAEIQLLVVLREMGVSAGPLQKKNTQFWVLICCLLQEQGVSFPENTLYLWSEGKQAQILPSNVLSIASATAYLSPLKTEIFSQ